MARIMTQLDILSKDAMGAGASSVNVVDHKGEIIAKAIESCLVDWGIQNLLTVTFDNATGNDARRISDWKGVIMENNFLHVKCNAHILNLIVKEGLSEQNKSISRVRNVVKYVLSSCARTTYFKAYVDKVKLDTRGLLSLDVEMRWNSIYLMLNTAVKFEKAFSRMYIDDHKYFKYFLDSCGKIEHPSSEDWRDVNVFLKFLEIFYQTTLKFSSTLHVTSNTFFHELFNLQSIIVNYSKCDDFLLTGMAKKMKGKFDKYWGDFDVMNMLLLLVAVVLDPRFKMKYVKFIFKNYYNFVERCSKSIKVTDTLTSLYNHYKKSIVGTSCETIGDQTDAVSEVSAMYTSDVWQSQWDKFLEKENNNIDNKPDLDKYLEDDVEKIKYFNILTWWKASFERYPVVSRIARDMLAIPTSIVASESVFSTSDRIFYCYRSSLSPKTAEALVCSQQWLRQHLHNVRLKIFYKKFKILK
ncbi:zinc finger BED domain-containing protein RICESLEEPER 2-like [Solanum verrucosum]|uniref:zinc finger BED domain-containing protein RICESLEEPER 2-like n=1 Tax=Solanum verrucosum TaxID=315347 RepID=UPI0020D06140|nr:zinc finger BED domain-containing protein RICESLEEPER 2-like [Solanum verrucosum]